MFNVAANFKNECFTLMLISMMAIYWGIIRRLGRSCSFYTIRLNGMINERTWWNSWSEGKMAGGDERDNALSHT